MTARRRGGAIPAALRLLPALVLAACVLAGGPARADVLVTNTDKLATDAKIKLGALPRAQGFVTGAGVVSLTSVEVGFGESLSSTEIADLTVSIWTADASDEPDSELVGLTNPMSITGCSGCSADRQHYWAYTGTPVVFPVASPTMLSASTRYFVRLYYDGSDKSLYSVGDDGETSSHGWTIDDDLLEGDAEPPTVWTADGNAQSLLFRINGTSVEPPDPPLLTGVSLTSMAPTSGFHLAGDTIEVTAAFDVNVTVAGTPHFELALSPAVREAAYESGSGTANLVFSYTVADGDDDPDGISWAANSLKLNGGTIRFTSTAAANQVDATLDHGAQVPDATRKVDAKTPRLAMGSVNGTALTLTFDEDLAAAASLANTAFTVKKTASGTEQTVTLSTTAPVISGKTVALVLSAAVGAADTLVKVSYVKPTTGTANKLVDAPGNEVADFTDSAVDNVLADSTPPELISSGAAVLAADGKTLTVTYNEALKEASIAADSAFTVKATPAGGSEATLALATGGVAVSGSTVVLTLAAPIADNDTAVKVSYAKPGSGAVIEDANGNDAAGFTDQGVTNNSLVLRLTIEAVYPDATPGIADVEFKVTRSNTDGGELEVVLDITQDAAYFEFTTQTFTLSAGQATRTIKVRTTYYSGEGENKVNLPSGNLTATLAASDNYAPGAGDTATVAMKMPSSGPPALAEIVPPNPVVEGVTVTVPVRTTTAAGVARPRLGSFTVAIYSEAYEETDMAPYFEPEQNRATINADYKHISGNIRFNLAGWRDIGGGVYRVNIETTLETLQDEEHESAEKVKLTLQNTPGVSQAIAPNRTIVPITILDDGDPLALTGVSLTSDAPDSMAPASGFHLAGAMIEVTAAFSGKVTVDGTPHFELALSPAGSTAVREAAYESGSGTANLVFSYTVADGDDDPDGISWAANSLKLNGGTIRFTSTEAAERVDAGLDHGAQVPDAVHKVDAKKPGLDMKSVNGTALTLTFDEDLAAAASLANAAFTVKKTASGTEQTVTLSATAPAISGKTVTLTLAAAVGATDILVKASYAKPTSGTANKLVDARGNEVADFTDEAVINVLGDTTVPMIETAVVDGTALTLTYNEGLDTGSVPVADDFAVRVSEQARAVSNVGVAGTAVTLTLADAVRNGNPVSVTYTKGTNPIRDLALNEAAGLSGRAVRNDTISPPGAPGDLRAVPGNERVTLSWDAPSDNGGAAIVNYQYRVSANGGTSWAPDWTDVPDGPDAGADPANERSYVLESLANNTAYTFQVRARNTMRFGTASQAEATPVAGPAADPGAPRTLQAQARDSAVSLSWQAPLDDGNRPLTRYEVRHAQGNTVPGNTAWEDGGQVLAYTVPNLTNGRQYTFEVRAVNTANRAGAAARVQATPEVNADAPSVVRSLRAVVRATEVRLYWNTPEREGDSRISRYEYRKARGSTLRAGAPWARLADYAGNGVGLLDLDTGVQYTFEVRAVNASGRAGPAARVRATPSSQAERAPGAPRNLRAVSGQPSVRWSETGKRAYVDVTLSWDAPASDGNSRIGGYEYRHAEGSSVPAGASWRGVELDTLTTKVRSLKAGTGYAFEMRAVNDVGASPAVRGRLTTARYIGATVTLQVSGSAREGEPFTLRARRSGSWTGDTYVFFELNDSAFANRYEHRVAYFGETGTTATATYEPPFDTARPSRRTFTVRVSEVKGDYAISSGTVTVTVADADAALSVADASVREGAGAKLVFAVRLDRTRDRTIRVDYATSDGTASAGSDYTAVSGTLSIPPGSRRAVIEVPVLDDIINDDGETLTLTLSNAKDAFIADGVATGTIRNTDSLPAAWLARFGRTVGEQAMEAVEARFGAPRAPGLLGRIGGQQLFGLSGAKAEQAEAKAAEKETRQGLKTLAGWVSGKSGKEADARVSGWRPLTGREMLTGSSFALTGGTAETGFGAFWGRGAATRFDGREGELTVDGEVASAMMGADFSRDAVVAGLMVSHSRGVGSYRSPNGSGEVESTLTGLFPYARYALSKRVSVWGMAGYGEGTLTLTRKDEAPMRPDMDVAMGAVGVRGVLFDGGTEGPTLAAKSDAMAVRTSTDAVTGLSASEADVTRVRFALEGSQPLRLGGDAVLTPSLELGVRHDGGDAETGFGADIGAGLALAAPSRGLSAAFRARGLLTHEAGGMRERGLSGTLAYDPAPDSDRGLSLRLSQTVGAQASGGADALLARRTLAGIGAEEDEGPLRRRLEARIGYGLGVFGERWTATPEIGLGLSDTGRELRLGWRLTERVAAGLAFELRVEGTRRESVDGAANPKHGLGVGLGWRLVKARTSHAAFAMRIAAHLDAANDDAPAEGRIGLMLTARW